MAFSTYIHTLSWSSALTDVHHYHLDPAIAASTEVNLGFGAIFILLY